MEPLLAKSRKPGQPEKTLPGHTDDVLASSEALFGRPGAPTPLARSWLRFFGLGPAEFNRFLRHLIVAAALHDLGKANDGFQAAVSGGGEQNVRHEHLSALMMADGRILSWLGRSGLDEMIVLSAVLSHHVKAGYDGDHEVGKWHGAKSDLCILSAVDDFSKVWGMIQAAVGSECSPAIAFPTTWKKIEIRRRREALKETFERWEDARQGDDGYWRFLSAVRAGLIVADAVGSAVVRMPEVEGDDPGKTLGRWVRDCFATFLTGDDVWREVIKRRIADLRQRGKWDDSRGHAFGDEPGGFTEFQCAVAARGHRVLLTAPCGSGKTLAAWNWIKVQLDERFPDRPISRVLFLYPTRATATEGFRDYVSWAPVEDAGLLSGTADYDLQDMFETPDARHGRNYRPDDRLYALGYWRKRIISATADQFFPFLQYGYGPLCLLPLLAESVVVVDEVHSFDASMFSTLKRFLKAFPDVPVLCMTATLPGERGRDLTQRCGLVPYPETPPADLVETSGHLRYHVEWIERGEAEDLVRTELREKRRVLWVANRVADCQATFAALRDRDDGVPTYCYHSRFKLEDRRNRHNDLVRRFQDSALDDAVSRGILGVTTQVCEMSLDLDADILVTELAPISALIQRMGRCNRDSKTLKTRPIGRVYVYKSDKEMPYTKEELDLAETFVTMLAGKDVSQDQLEEAYKECDPGEVEADKYCPFLDSGPYAEARREVSFREGDDFTFPCVLDGKDLDAVKQRIANRQPIDGYIVPVPHWLAEEIPRSDGDRLPRWLWKAPASRYDPMTGFDDQPRPDEGARDS